mgnify:CR=1 FL=1
MMLFDFQKGGMSYNPSGVVAATSDHLAWVLGACALSFVGAYMQYFGALQSAICGSSPTTPPSS